jgi:hypothetical protein
MRRRRIMFRLHFTASPSMRVRLLERRRRDAREKADMINSRRKNIINGHLLVPYSSKMAGFCAEIGLIGFVSAGNASVSAFC